MWFTNVTTGANKDCNIIGSQWMMHLVESYKAIALGIRFKSQKTWHVRSCADILYDSSRVKRVGDVILKLQNLTFYAQPQKRHDAGSKEVSVGLSGLDKRDHVELSDPGTSLSSNRVADCKCDIMETGDQD